MKSKSQKIRESRRKSQSENLPPGYMQKTQQIIERRLRLGKGKCLMTVGIVGRQVLRELGANRDKMVPVVLESLYFYVSQLMEKYGGYVWDHISRHKPGEKTVMRRVYKFG